MWHNVRDEISKLRSAAAGLREQARELTVQADAFDLAATRMDLATRRDEHEAEDEPENEEEPGDTRQACRTCARWGYSDQLKCDRCHGSGYEPSPPAGGGEP